MTVNNKSGKSYQRGVWQNPTLLIVFSWRRPLIVTTTNAIYCTRPSDPEENINAKYLILVSYQVYNGILISNGETVQNIAHLKVKVCILGERFVKGEKLHNKQYMYNVHSYSCLVACLFSHMLQNFPCSQKSSPYCSKHLVREKLMVHYLRHTA